VSSGGAQSLRKLIRRPDNQALRCHNVKNDTNSSKGRCGSSLLEKKLDELYDMCRREMRGGEKERE
jgi:hypothetical protein